MSWDSDPHSSSCLMLFTSSSPFPVPEWEQQCVVWEEGKGKGKVRLSMGSWCDMLVLVHEIHV